MKLSSPLSLQIASLLRLHLPVKPLLFILFSMPLQAAVNSAQQCRHYDDKIDAVKQRMRQLYTIKQGEYFKQKLTGLEAERRRCEKTAQLQLNRQAAKKQQKRLKKAKIQQRALAGIAAQADPNAVWTTTAPSKARLKQWQLLQQQEAAKLEKLKEKYKGAIQSSEDDQ